MDDREGASCAYREPMHVFSHLGGAICFQFIEEGTIFWADIQINTFAYAVMHGLWRSATEKSGCADTRHKQTPTKYAAEETGCRQPPLGPKGRLPKQEHFPRLHAFLPIQGQKSEVHRAKAIY